MILIQLLMNCAYDIYVYTVSQEKPDTTQVDNFVKY